MVYEQTKDINTHGFLRGLSEKNPDFLESDFNQLMRMKLKDSFVMPKKTRVSNPKAIEFDGDFESANLEFVSEIQENEYELYLRNDTNTHGHQSWFLFKIKNNSNEKKTITINVCNLKRYLPLFADGGKCYGRKMSEIGQPQSEWAHIGSNYQFKVNNQSKFSNVRVYKLTF